eukprot:COSAG04_NODE_19147_length_423_cov_1.114198_2_plen_29_part_01
MMDTLSSKLREADSRRIGPRPAAESAGPL